jgi:DNA replication and repair protein RecF
VGQEIAPNQPKLSLFYKSFSGLSPTSSLQLLERSFREKLTELETAELRSGSTLVGPHRDDWSFTFGEHVLKGHGSQGEVRSALLALKLLEIELFQKRTGHQPILLLDDFSSELDQERRGFLLRYLMNTQLQVFVTTTEDSVALAMGVGKRFQVQEGKLKEWKDLHEYGKNSERQLFS